MAEKKNRLIIVVTRADAPKDGDSDEFVQEWGFAAKRLFRLKEVKANEGFVYVLILHGCDKTKGKLPEIFDKAIEEERSLPSKFSKAWFCHHGMTPQDQQKLKKKIIPYVNRNNLKSYSYSSMGSGPAVDNLLKEFPEDLAKIVGDIPNGRLFFVKRLHALQSCLLRLQFCIAILYSDEKTTEEKHRLQAIEEAQKIGEEIGKTIGFDGFMEHLYGIESLATGRDDTQAAVKLVRVLSGANSIDDRVILAMPEFWRGYTEQEPYEHLPAKCQQLEDDFRLFAMALDCLMDESSRLQIELERTSSGTGTKTG